MSQASLHSSGASGHRCGGGCSGEWAGGGCGGGVGCGGCGGCGGQSRSHHRGLEEEISKPQLLCACKIPLSQKTSHTARNPDREYYFCQKIETNEPYSCKTWLWVDLVTDYVDKMAKYRTSFLQEKHGRELAAVREELHQKAQALSKRESEMRDQGLAQQIETSELQSHILAIQYQINFLSSSASKFRKLRMVMMLLLAPGSILITLAATAVTALMFLV